MAEDVPIVFSLQDKRGAEGQVWLGFCVRGIVVYNVHKDVKTPIHHCPWKKTKNISFAVSIPAGELEWFEYLHNVEL